MLPKGLSDALMTVHAKHPFPDTPQEIAAIAAQVRDPNFRVQVSPAGPACLQPRRPARRPGRRSSCGRSSDSRTTPRMRSTWASRLARAEIAWQLGKRYVQDQPLDWGCAVEPRRPTSQRLVRARHDADHRAARAGNAAPAATRHDASADE